ncbi:MAG TPA: efflux RND transporter periplasmic adaptor subunit [Gemmataceae bacterium]|jgi:membrane fusion protein (multidrug efflux system)|nr:efflux RND transporter periplasmic adaptor subunit [Gemmataceae bacterium]
MTLRAWVGAFVLLLLVAGLGAGLGYYKYVVIQKAIDAAKLMPEPMEVVAVAEPREREYRRSTTAIGTVLALRSVTLRNEVAGMVKYAALTPGQVVEPGAVLVALDVSVEEAELKAQQAHAAQAERTLARAERANKTVTDEEIDKARAERDVAVAQMARIKAVIAKKTIRAPFRGRVGISDIHPGQYLNEGAQLTTLQGVDQASHVDFSLPQTTAAELKPGDGVDVFVAGGTPVPAKVVAVDAKVDPTTRNAVVRARMETANGGPAPGAAVRVRVPVGPTITAVAVPVSALRKGPGGDHVFVIVDVDGKPRAKPRLVETGTVVGDEVLIVGGLKVGEKVAASGSFKLRDGVLVGIAEPK